MDRRATTQALDDRQADAASNDSVPARKAARKAAEGGSIGISLLVQHPGADLSGLSDALALPAHRTWNKGDPITTPTGRRVGGTYPASRWNYVWPRTRGSGISAKLLIAVDQLAARREVLRQVRDSGGTLQVILRVAGYGHIGDTIDPELLSRLSDLGVSLGIEFFAEPQNG